MLVCILIFTGICAAHGMTPYTDYEKDVQKFHTLFHQLRSLMSKVITATPSRYVTTRNYVKKYSEQKEQPAPSRNDVKRHSEPRKQSVTSRNYVNRRSEGWKQRVTSRNDIKRQSERWKQTFTSRNDVNRRSEGWEHRVTSRNDIKRRSGPRKQTLTSRNDVNRRSEGWKHRVTSKNYVERRSEAWKQPVTSRNDVIRRSDVEVQTIWKSTGERDLFVMRAQPRTFRKIGPYTSTIGKPLTHLAQRQGTGNAEDEDAAPSSSAAPYDIGGDYFGTEDYGTVDGNHTMQEEEVTIHKGLHEHVDSFSEFLLIVLDTISRKSEEVVMSLKMNIYVVLNQAYLDGLFSVFSPSLRERLLMFAQIVHHAPVKKIVECSSQAVRKLVKRELLHNDTNLVINIMDNLYIDWDLKQMNRIAEDLKKLPRGSKHATDILYDILVRVGLHPIYRLEMLEERAQLVDIYTQYMNAVDWIPKRKRKLKFRADDDRGPPVRWTDRDTIRTMRKMQFRNVFRLTGTRYDERKSTTTRSFRVGTQKFIPKGPINRRRNSRHTKMTRDRHLELKQKLNRRALANRRGHNH